MGKTRDQRLKELTKPSAVLAAWNAIKGAAKGQLDAPIFKKLGDMGARAQEYDKATAAFLATAKKKDDAKKIYLDGAKQVQSGDGKIDGLVKSIDDVAKDENASIKTSELNTPEDMLKYLDDLIKGQTDLNKERQSIFDNLMKAYDARLKTLNDASDKLQKAVDAANSELDRANKDIDDAEQEIRKLVRTYYTTALDIDRKDVADGVNKLLAEFAK